MIGRFGKFVPLMAMILVTAILSLQSMIQSPPPEISHDAAVMTLPGAEVDLAGDLLPGVQRVEYAAAPWSPPEHRAASFALHDARCGFEELRRLRDWPDPYQAFVARGYRTVPISGRAFAPPRNC